VSSAGYAFKHFPCPGVNSGGDTGLMYTESVDVKCIDAGQKPCFEFSELGTSTLKVVVVYKPPYSSTHFTVIIIIGKTM